MSSKVPEESDFLQPIIDEVNSGYGFVPIIGSGLSAPSGIPTGTEFGEYLFDYLTKILAGEESWNPEQPTWPRMEDGRPTKSLDPAAKLDWIRRQLSQYKTKGASLEAIASMADWRTALTFLSRLPPLVKTNLDPAKIDAPKTVDLGKLVLRAPAENVVDSSFIHITAGRQPGVGHMMLAHLSDALRIQTILTTNFDSLIEEAFARLGMPLITIDVHQKAGLPSAQLVLAQRAIVKLHGGRYGLRADYSLDEIPPEKDQDAFAGLFRQRAEQAGGNAKARKHMLVMGVSGSDARTMKLIKYAAENIDGLQIHWICHQKQEAGSIREKLNLADKLKIRIEPDLGLFLFELYQRHYLSLPPAGAYYPAVARVPPGRYRLDENKSACKTTRTRFRHYKQILLDAINGQAKNGKESTWVTAVGGDRYKSGGVSSVATEAYETLYRDFRCVWLQLDHFADESEFLVSLVDAVSHRVGMFSTIPPMPQIDRVSCRNYLTELLQRSYRPFLVFVNGRDGLGKNAGWVRDSKRWSGRKQAERWSGRQQSEFWKTVQSLAQESLRFVVLYGNDSLKRPGKELVGSKLHWRRKSIDLHVTELVNRVDQYIASQEYDADATWRKARFIYALTLFRHSCHPSALSTWGLVKAPRRLAAGADNDQARTEECHKLIIWLTGNGLIRHQRGGTVWMHSDVADAVRTSLENSSVVNGTGISNLRVERAACHQGIADWYVKLFRSSNDPHAALESLYHRICCLEYSNKLKDPFDLRRTSVLEAIETLNLARTRILSCGSVKTSSNLMKQIMDLNKAQPALFEGIKPFATKLRRSSLDLLRDFSREGADFKEADKYAELLHKKQADHEKPFTAESMRTLASLRSLVAQAENLTSLRKYRKAENKFHTAFKILGICVRKKVLRFLVFQEYQKNKNPKNMGDEKALGEFVIAIRKDTTKWCSRKLRTNEESQLVITALGNYMFLQMLIGQSYSLECTSDGDKQRTKRWQYAEAVYTAATTIMRYVEDHDYLQIENTTIRSHYGVLMACLQRYSEAHRRLNEASGYLSQSTRASDGLAWAVIDLRRAETYLRQAEDKIDRIGAIRAAFDRHPAERDEELRRSAAAFLDDTRYALDRVEQRFVDQRKDIWWWTLRYELQLWFYVAQVELHNAIAGDDGPHTTRNKSPLSQLDIRRCTRLVREGFEFLQTDIVRQARLVEHLNVLIEHDEPNGKLEEFRIAVRRRLKNRIKSIMKEDPMSIETSLRNYVDRVLKSRTRRHNQPAE